MKLQMPVLGLGALRRNFGSISRVVIDPQSGISDAMERALDQTVVKRARMNVWRIFDTSGDFPSRIRTKKINQYRVDVVVEAVYAAVHEYGGTFTVTPRQRRFFWAKYRETGEDMWKALALSVTYTIPARPYLRPAIDAERGYAMAITASTLAHRMEKAVGRQ